MNKKVVLLIIGGILLLCLCSVCAIIAVLLYNNYRNTGELITINPTPVVTSVPVTSVVEPTLFMPTATPVNTLGSINDTFDNSNNDWQIGNIDSTYQTTTKTITGGKYVWDMTAKQSVNAFSDLPVTPTTDFSVSADVQRISGPATSDMGLVFNEADDGNFYNFVIADIDQSFAVYIKYQGDWTKLIGWSDSALIKPGEVNNLKVVVSGSLMTFYINGTKVDSLDNDQLSMNGYAGISVDLEDTGDKAVVQFDNFQYYVIEF